MTDRNADVTALSWLNEPVRRRLYEWVTRQARPVGREEAARATGITRALATFHLDKLADAGLLNSGYQRLSGKTGPGAGRPARVYWRGDREFYVSVPERQYQRVAELFASALEQLSSEPVPAPLKDAATTLGETLGAEGRMRDASEPLVAALEAGGYEPEVDATGTIRLRNCPFHALAQQHRTMVCGANLALAEGLTRGAGAGELRPVLDPQPGFCCVAFVQPRAAPGGAG